MHFQKFPDNFAFNVALFRLWRNGWKISAQSRSQINAQLTLYMQTLQDYS